MAALADWLRVAFRGRPGWMNALMVFSAYMAFIYVPWDFFFKPIASDEEVWFGVLFTGLAAKFLEPLHWWVYASGAYGFRRMRPWMWPWASIYTGQVALGMLVWCALYAPGGRLRWLFGVVSFLAFAALAVALWRARPSFRPPLGTLRGRYGPAAPAHAWALVTGASSGLGREFARSLAREGFSLVLSARREDRLRELAAELEEDFGAATRVVAADLVHPAGVDFLAAAVEGLEISLLINNAGVGYQGRFDLLDAERLRAMVQLNCVAPVALAHRFLPGMRERGRGAMVITGSVAGRQPLPLHAVYSATKAFDQLFGEALSAELHAFGVDVLVLEPGSTETEFQAVAGELPHEGAAPDLVVREALEALQFQPSAIYGWFNWIRANAAQRLLPRTLTAAAAGRMMARQTPEGLR